MKYTFDIWSCDYDCCDMTRIFIRDSERKIIDEEWGMDNYPTDKEAVLDLLKRNSLLSVDLEKLVNSERFCYYDLDDNEVEI